MGILKSHDQAAAHVRTSKLPDGREVICAQDVEPTRLMGMRVFAAQMQAGYEPEWEGVDEDGDPLQSDEGTIVSVTERHDRELGGPDMDIRYMVDTTYRANAMFCWVLRSELDRSVTLTKRGPSEVRSFMDGFDAAMDMMVKLHAQGHAGEGLVDAMRVRSVILHAMDKGEVRDG